jgi:hypothetical protein
MEKIFLSDKNVSILPFCSYSFIRKMPFKKEKQIILPMQWYTGISVADPDPGSGAFLPPGSGIRIRDPG